MPLGFLRHDNASLGVILGGRFQLLGTANVQFSDNLPTPLNPKVQTNLVTYGSRLVGP
jgi:hypothetical protein